MAGNLELLFSDSSFMNCQNTKTVSYLLLWLFTYAKTEYCSESHIERSKVYFRSREGSFSFNIV
jgi:hypothetical protein